MCSGVLKLARAFVLLTYFTLLLFWSVSCAIAVYLVSKEFFDAEIPVYIALCALLISGAGLVNFVRAEILGHEIRFWLYADAQPIAISVSVCLLIWGLVLYIVAQILNA